MNDIIPIDLIDYILRFLNNKDWASCQLVCKLWYSATPQQQVVDRFTRTVNTCWSCLMFKAVPTNSKRLIKALLADPYVDPAGRRNKAVRAAAYYNHLVSLKLLLKDNRVDPMDGDMTSRFDDDDALELASERGNFEALEILLQSKKVDPTNNGCYSITNCNSLNCIVLLLNDHRVSWKDEIYPIVCKYWVMRKRWDLVAILLSDYKYKPARIESFDVSQFNPDWVTDLLWVHAIKYNHTDIINYILDQRDLVDPSVKNNYALKQACEFGNVQLVERLLADNRVRPSVFMIGAAYTNHHDKIVHLLRSRLEAEKCFCWSIEKKKP